MYRRVFLADVACSASVATTPLRRHGTELHRVHIQGLCVWCERLGAAQLRVEIDDGTDVALVQVRGDAVAAELQDVQSGKMVKVLGDVRETPLFASGRSWRRWIDATSVSVVDDPNAESLHTLEMLHLHQTIYLTEMTTDTGAQPPRAGTLPMLSLPSVTPVVDSTVGVKRKAEPLEPKPRSQQQPIVLEMATHANVLNQPMAAIPPAEYQFHVSSADLKLIAAGAKTLEIRLNNPPYSIIRANDRIKFNGRTLSTVHAVRKYAQLHTALEMETLSSLLPPANGGSAVNIHAAVRHLRQFISQAEETNHGVAVFEIRVQAPPAAQRSPEEWSQLLCSHVGSAGAGGCSLHDLQFAFPSLPVETIQAMLTDLQMDAVVYLLQGTYRIV